MKIFVNCHIFKKNTEIVIYDKKKPMPWMPKPRSCKNLGVNP